MSEPEDHIDIINEFVSITQADPEIAKQILSNNDWDLSSSVLIYLDNKDSFSVPQVDEEYVRPPIESKKMRLVDPPVHKVNRQSKGSTPESIFTAFRDLKREQEQMSNHGSTKKYADLADLFRPPYDLLFRGNFQEAKEASLSSQKHLLVNIQSEKEFDCHRLNRDTWSNSIVKDIIKKNFIMWQAQLESISAKAYVKKFKIKSAPHIAIYDPETNKIVERWDKFLSPEEFCDNIRMFQLANNINVDENFKNTKSSKNILDLTEEEQLAEAIRLSMQQSEEEEGYNDITIISDDDDESDDDDKVEKKRERENIILPTNTKKQFVDNETNGNYDIDMTYEDIPPSEEESEEELEEEIDESEKTTLHIRFPDETSIKKEFNCNLLLERVFNFVKKSMKNKDFSLFTPFPRREYSKEDFKKLTLLQADLHPRAVIIVQPND